MEFSGRAPETTRVDDGYRLPDHSPPHAQMTADALRRELVKERIRQELIVAELAGQRELGPKELREFRLENAGPLGARADFQLTTLPHHDTNLSRKHCLCSYQSRLGVLKRHYLGQRGKGRLDLQHQTKKDHMSSGLVLFAT